MDVLHSVSIPAGFTQCRWSTSREPSSPLQCETEYLFFPFLPPHSLPHRRTHFYHKSYKIGYQMKAITLLPLPHLPLPFSSSSQSFLLLLPSLPVGAVICPFRGGESVTCRLAPSSYDTRWHSTAVIDSTGPGSGDQIISLPASISHVLMCYTENRSHAIRMKPAKWPTGPLPAISPTCVREMLGSGLVDSKVVALGLEFDGRCSKVSNAAWQAYTSLNWKPRCLRC